jgi:hypothetical protein
MKKIRIYNQKMFRMVLEKRFGGFAKMDMNGKTEL